MIFFWLLPLQYSTIVCVPSVHLLLLPCQFDTGAIGLVKLGFCLSIELNLPISLWGAAVLALLLFLILREVTGSIGKR